MKADAITTLTSLARKPFGIAVGDRTRIYRPAGDGSWTVDDPPQPGAQPAALQIHTLEGLVAYLGRNLDGRAGVVGEMGQPQKNRYQDHALHVVSETEVRLIGKLGEFPVRESLVVASFVPLIGNTRFDFGKWLNQDTFIIGLLSLFVDTPERAQVLKLVGNLRDEAVRTLVDDGFSQEATLKVGAQLSERGSVPNAITLQPYRTFREVAQPESLFILRLQGGGENELPKIALFEADGGAWRLSAIQYIADYLSKKLADSIAVIA